MRPCRYMFVFALLAVTALPAAAAAGDCGPDCLSLFFSLLHGRTRCLGGSIPANFEAYLVLTDPTMEAVSALTIAFVTDGPVVVTAVDAGGGQVCDPADPEGFCHLWDPPLPTPGETMLAVATVLYTGNGEAAFLGVRNAGTPVDDRPWVVLPDGSSMPLNPSGGPGEPLAQLGGECAIVPAADRAWSAVKGLYR